MEFTGTVMAGLILGGLIGYFFRGNIQILSLTNGMKNVLLYLLLFFLGISTGSNTAVTEHLGELGWISLALGLAGTMGSVTASALLHRFGIWR